MIKYNNMDMFDSARTDSEQERERDLWTVLGGMWLYSFIMNTERPMSVIHDSNFC